MLRHQFYLKVNITQKSDHMLIIQNWGCVNRSGMDIFFLEKTEGEHLWPFELGVLCVLLPIRRTLCE